MSDLLRHYHLGCGYRLQCAFPELANLQKQNSKSLNKQDSKMTLNKRKVLLDATKTLV